MKSVLSFSFELHIKKAYLNPYSHQGSGNFKPLFAKKVVLRDKADSSEETLQGVILGSMFKSHERDVVFSSENDDLKNCVKILNKTTRRIIKNKDDIGLHHFYHYFGIAEVDIFVGAGCGSYLLSQYINKCKKTCLLFKNVCKDRY